jgi:hypothetical protein
MRSSLKVSVVAEESQLKRRREGRVARLEKSLVKGLVESLPEDLKF